MTTATVSQLPRVFKLGVIELEDPSPSKTPQEAWNMLKKGFSHIKNEILSSPFIEDGKEVFVIEQAPVKSNG